MILIPMPGSVVAEGIGFFFGGEIMDKDKRIAQIGIIVEDMDSVHKLNEFLHEYGEHIIGRMGIPFREKNISIISIVLHAEQDVISSLAGKLGMLKGVSVKTIYSKK
jgi:putative iron-only hydrogenase system regulator